jgi:hypothetical protein
MPAANPDKTNGDDAAKVEDEDDDGGQREQRGGLINPAVELLSSATSSKTINRHAQK